MNKAIFACAMGAAAALLWTARGQESEFKKAANYRTSPAGYSDTPVLPGQKWKVHDIDRPRPRVVTPGATPGAPPSDAIVLFDGKDLSKWEIAPRSGGGKKKEGPPPPSMWKLGSGYFEVAGGAGTLRTREKFGDVQLHIEWSAPTILTGDSQLRGNSGVLLMERYEIQVLDTYNNPTYADGGAGSIYGQWPPLVNATRKPGEWNAYDIIFEAPKFEGERLVKPAYVTVLHNGVLLHHRQEIIGRMAHRVVGTYAPHGPEEPLALQDHGDAVRYRNIWIRRLKGYDEP